MPRYGIRGALAVVMLVLAGCGGGSSSSSTTAQASTFRSDFKLTITQFKQTSHGIGLAIEHAGRQSDAQVATVFGALALQWQADLTRLQSLKPPVPVAGEFITLRGAATRTEADLKSIVAAAQTHDAAKARRLGASLVRDILTAKNASQAILSKLGTT